MTITARQAVNTPLLAQVALVENQTGTFKNVFRKPLFGKDGETITIAFTQGQTLFVQKDNVDINVPITNPTQLTLIGYIEDKNTKEIYQSVVLPVAAPGKTGSAVVGLEQQSVPTTLNGITVYPNPANGSFYLGLPEDRSADGFTWKLVDQRGVTVKSGDFNDLINNTRQVEVAGFANGIYFVVLQGPGGSTVHKKIVIMNRN